MLDTIQSLWVGPLLSTMERICAESFLRIGHPLHLYTYGPVEGVPKGVTIKDATEITPEGSMGRFQNLANFSDFFRYSLLYKRGNWWVDLDTYCLRPFDFRTEYVFSTQLEVDRVTVMINSGNIKAPAGSALLKHCLDRIAEMDVMKTGWAAIGPTLLCEVVHHFHLEGYAKPNHVFCPLDWFTAPQCLTNPNTQDAILRGDTFGRDERSVHLWNSQWRRAGFDKDAVYPDSLYEVLKKGWRPECRDPYREGSC